MCRDSSHWLSRLASSNKALNQLSELVGLLEGIPPQLDKTVVGL